MFLVERMRYMTRDRYEPIAIRYLVEFLLIKMSVVKDVSSPQSWMRLFTIVSSRFI